MIRNTRSRMEIVRGLTNSVILVKVYSLGHKSEVVNIQGVNWSRPSKEDEDIVE